MESKIRKIGLVILALSMFATLIPLPTTQAQEYVATSVAALNVRATPSANAQRLGQLAWGTEFVLEGRNAAATWAFGHTRDGSLRGWVSVRYLRFDFSLSALPVVDATGSVSASQAEQPAPAPTSGGVAFSSGVISNARTIFQRGQALGNRANIFTVVGDSITTEQPFLKGFGVGDYDLGQYAYLQDTINYFSVSPRGGIPNSWVHNSVAASAAFTSAAVLDFVWADASLCLPNELPLECEYRITRPSVAIIMLGSIDVRFMEAPDYRRYMSRIIEISLEQGVIPVLTTFPNGPTYYPDKSAAFNDVIRSLAAQNAIPLIELRVPVMALPANGVRDDQYHLSQDGAWYGFQGDETRVGITMRNFFTLQALDTLRREVLAR